MDSQDTDLGSSPHPQLIDSDDFIVDQLSQPIQILFQDEHFVAVFKPAGLMVHRGPMTQASEPVLLQTLRDQLGQFVYPIHRLDRPTAGLVLFGLSREAAQRLGDLFASRRVRKTYHAMVRGHVLQPGVIDRDLQDISSGELEPSVPSQGPLQNATTHYRPIQLYEAPGPLQNFATCRLTLLELEPLTGRWHQIRRHLNHFAHPVIGDHRHGDHRWNQWFFAQTQVYRMLLTATHLTFEHPFLHTPIDLQAPRGSQFETALQWLAPFTVSLDSPNPNAPIGES